MVSFKELQEMTSFIPPAKIKHIKSSVFAGEGKTLEFYEGLASGKFTSEVATKRHFYPEEKNRNENFNWLKRNLQEKLSDLILLIDYNQSPYENPSTGYIYCIKKLVIVNTWIYFGRPFSGIVSLAEKTMRVAKYHGFAEIVFFVARYCYYYYQKINKFEKAGYFESLLDNSSEIVRLEAKIDIIQNRVHRIVKKSARSLTMEQETYLEESANFIHDIRLNHSSYRINTTGVLTLILLYNTLKETQKVIQLFEMVIQDAKESPNKYPSRHLNIFYGQAVEQFIKIGEYEKAKKLYQERKSDFKEGSRNWFTFNQIYVFLMLHEKDYSKAYDASQYMIEHSLFRRVISPTFQQHIHITNAYIQFLVKAGKVEGVLPESSDFKVSSFLKKVPTYRYDTGGYGFSVNIAEFIHRLVDKDYDILIDKRESLMSYTNKHLKSEGDYRPRYFLRMLVAVVTKNFSRLRVEAYVKEKRYLTQLRKVPLAEAKQELALEIIPFEDLWEIVLDVLD